MTSVEPIRPRAHEEARKKQEPWPPPMAAHGLLGSAWQVACYRGWRWLHCVCSLRAEPTQVVVAYFVVSRPRLYTRPTCPTGATAAYCDRCCLPVPIVLSIAADQPLPASALDLGAAGVWVGGEIARPQGGTTHGALTLAEVLRRVRELRATLAPGALLIAGGVGQPDDMRQLAHAGAQLYAADAGLVFSGPALIKRCNEALLHEISGGAQPLQRFHCALRAVPGFGHCAWA
jgi:hypothetical protein